MIEKKAIIRDSPSIKPRRKSHKGFKYYHFRADKLADMPILIGPYAARYIVPRDVEGLNNGNLLPKPCEPPDLLHIAVTTNLN